MAALGLAQQLLRPYAFLSSKSHTDELLKLVLKRIELCDELCFVMYNKPLLIMRSFSFYLAAVQQYVHSFFFESCPTSQFFFLSHFSHWFNIALKPIGQSTLR